MVNDMTGTARPERTSLHQSTITRAIRIVITIALTIVWIAPASAQLPTRRARQGELVIIRLHDGRELFGEVVSILNDSGFFIKLPDEVSPRLISVADISAIRAANGGVPLSPPAGQPAKRRAKISTANKVLIAVAATVGGILLIAYFANPRD